MTIFYPPVYHAALNHLIEHATDERAVQGRALCAAALRALRAQHRSREQLRWERNHMRQICGRFPLKGAR